MTEKQSTLINAEEVEKDYQENFMPKVHVIGRTTMAISFILAFLPVLYYYFFKGYKLPFSNYANVITVITGIGVGMWLTEPLAFWPTLGSAGTYISYLSGNVSAMRFPVALNVQSAMDADINTAKGQVVTIIGIVASVFTNLLILLIIVLTGSWLVSHLPSSVLGAFAFVMPALYGSMLMLRIGAGNKGVKHNIMVNLPYLVTALAVKVIITYLKTWIPSLGNYGVTIAVLSTILVAYIIYKIKE